MSPSKWIVHQHHQNRWNMAVLTMIFRWIFGSHRGRWKSSSLWGRLRRYSGHVTMWRWKSWQWWVCLAFLDRKCASRNLKMIGYWQEWRCKVFAGILGKRERREEWKSLAGYVWLRVPLSFWTWAQQASQGDAAMMFRKFVGTISVKPGCIRVFWSRDSFSIR